MAIRGAKRGSSRARWSLADKVRIVERTLREGVSSRAIAREEGLSSTSLSKWRALYHDGKLAVAPALRGGKRLTNAVFLPVTMTPASRAVQPLPEGGAQSRSIVQITVASGATMRVEATAIETSVLCALVEQLLR